VTKQEVDPAKVYVIGGLVDTQVIKWASLRRAQQHHVPCARLPLREHLPPVSRPHLFQRLGVVGDRTTEGDARPLEVMGAESGILWKAMAGGS
jgi:hypothetical protein